MAFFPALHKLTVALEFISNLSSMHLNYTLPPCLKPSLAKRFNIKATFLSVNEASSNTYLYSAQTRFQLKDYILNPDFQLFYTRQHETLVSTRLFSLRHLLRINIESLVGGNLELNKTGQDFL
ncbi:hypothetical protein NPIL_5311 [Nephila pilipes]|uniref:Uncharacterized protein n=1 Tax=Nephila pilipes TaxID=299642 RepID=A0A8X6QA80_NEPPI|nr:hypothetical protein NPIL_5311 [Nephila pilipes]